MEVPLDASLNNFSLEYSYDELAIATNNFDPSSQLGKGTYGAVFRGVRRDGTDIAIKVLEMPDEAGFEEEVCVLSKFLHPNLVILMGFARRGSTRYLIYEMLAGGDCYERLRECAKRGLPFTWRERLSAAFDACCGLSHLHHATPKAFHRDIKTANILLDRNGTAKMADFGLACLSHSMAHRVEKTAGTTGYACPLYAQRAVITEGSEVYSFGVVLLEMLTNICPAILLQYPDGSQHYKFLVCEISGSVVTALQLSDKRANWPVDLARGLAWIALRCIEEREELRPDFVEVVNNLRHLRDSQPQEAHRIERITHVTPESRQIVDPLGANLGHAYAPWQEPTHAQRQVFHQNASQAFAPPLAQQRFELAAMPIPRPRPTVRLWSLRCSYAEIEHFDSLAQEQLAIVHWQEMEASPATTLRVGRMFQESLFNKLPPECSALVSREHFQIWAEELNMSGITERKPTKGVPCSFFLTNFSLNGTIVNGVNISGKNGQVQIHHGDRISIPRIRQESDGTVVIAPFIQFHFDLSGSILLDTSFADD